MVIYLQEKGEYADIKTTTKEEILQKENNKLKNELSQCKSSNVDVIQKKGTTVNFGGNSSKQCEKKLGSCEAMKSKCANKLFDLENGSSTDAPLNMVETDFSDKDSTMINDFSV